MAAKWILGLPLAGWQGVFFAGPILLMLAMTFWSVKSYVVVPDATLANWTAVLKSASFWQIYFRTLFLSAGAAGLAILVSLPLAYMIAFRVSRNTQRLLMAALVAPYFTSYLARAYTWRFMLEDKGVINGLLQWFGLGAVTFQGSYTALIVGYFALFFSLVAFIVTFGMSLIDKRYLEAAANLGASPLRSFWTIVLPLCLPSIVVGFSCAFTLAMGDFVVPSYIGGGARPTLSILIVNAIQGQSNFPRAAVIATIMLITLAVVLGAVQRLFKQGAQK